MTVTAILPTLPLLALSEDEQSLVHRLQNLRSTCVPDLELRDAYYNGNQIIRDLGISLPPQLRGLKVVIGWPQVAVDAIDERLEVEGFRWGTDKGAEKRLNTIWQENDLDNEGPLAHLDALIHRAAFICVGTNADGSALVTPESELSMSSIWDPRTRSVGAAMRVYGGDETRSGTGTTSARPRSCVWRTGSARRAARATRRSRPQSWDSPTQPVGRCWAWRRPASSTPRRSSSSSVPTSPRSSRRTGRKRRSGRRTSAACWRWSGTSRANFRRWRSSKAPTRLRSPASWPSTGRTSQRSASSRRTCSARRRRTRRAQTRSAPLRRDS